MTVLVSQGLTIHLRHKHSRIAFRLTIPGQNGGLTTRILNLEQFLSQNKMRIYMIQIIRRLTSKQGCFYYKILHILLVCDTSVT